jgi:hypothetical protein
MHFDRLLRPEWSVEMKRCWPLLFVVLFSGCFDILDTPPKQCDAERRCTSGDAPVCGDDGEWYPCGSQMECMGAEPAPEVVCEDGCPEFSCDLECANTRTTTDDSGCLTCECVSDCPSIDLDCETEMGPDGCPRCVETECGEVACALFCEDGFAVDEDGCPVCACKQPACPDIACADGCTPVYDDAGCITDCDCSSTCEPFDREACQAEPNCEVVTGPDGCETCLCEEDECQRQFCNNFCEHGYEIVDGCPTCECHTPCADMPQCDLFCPNGNTIEPNTGCVDSCECRPDEMCDPVVCTLFCPNGFAIDENGCEVCECAGAPCASDEDCGLDEHCTTPPGGPLDGDGAPQGECVALEPCDPNLRCPDGGQCGFYFRNDCCPPLTTCTDDLPSCPAVCLL